MIGTGKRVRRQTQARPVSFLHVLGEELAARSRRAGIRIRITAEEAVNWGVPREYMFHRNGSMKVNAVRVFSSVKGSIRCVPTKHISLDLDTVDGVRWGIWTDVDMEVVADLVRASFELDPAGFDRDDERYAAFMADLDSDRFEPEPDEWRMAA